MIFYRCPFEWLTPSSKFEWFASHKNWILLIFINFQLFRAFVFSLKFMKMPRLHMHWNSHVLFSQPTLKLVQLHCKNSIKRLTRTSKWCFLAPHSFVNKNPINISLNCILLLGIMLTFHFDISMDDARKKYFCTLTAF